MLAAPRRRRPARGVHIFRGSANIVFLTVCTERRGRSLVYDGVACDLVASWSLAEAWMVGRYVIMPDHLHLFCAPVDEAFTIESWVTFGKAPFAGCMERRTLDFNPAVSIIVCGRRRATTRNGITRGRIRCARGWCGITGTGRLPAS